MSRHSLLCSVKDSMFIFCIRFISYLFCIKQTSCRTIYITYVTLYIIYSIEGISQSMVDQFSKNTAHQLVADNSIFLNITELSFFSAILCMIYKRNGLIKTFVMTLARLACNCCLPKNGDSRTIRLFFNYQLFIYQSSIILCHGVLPEVHFGLH
jgi:hypothetical protein